MFILTNNQLCTCMTLLCTFCTHVDMKLPNFTSLVCGLGEHRKIIVTFFY